MTDHSGFVAQPAPTTSNTIYSVSRGLVGWLEKMNVSMAFSSPKANRFCLVGRGGNGGLRIDECFVHEAMGIAIQDNRIVLATKSSVIEMSNSLTGNQRANEHYDACYVPRRIHLLGAVDHHDIGLDDLGEPYLVITKFNCLARLSKHHNFHPIWKPPFISTLIAEDRCHLNGLAMEAGKPALVTAVSKSNTIDGWRDRRKDGGVLIDVGSDEIVAHGLSMPHSPRVYRGDLYVLDSGRGNLLKIDRRTGGQEEIAFFPGFTRGLTLIGNYAVVGLSQPRHRFSGLELTDRLEQENTTPWTGIQIVNLETGAIEEWLRIDGQVQEIYDVAVVTGVSCAMSFPPNSVGYDELISWESLEQ